MNRCLTMLCKWGWLRCHELNNLTYVFYVNRQHVVSNSSAKAEYWGVASVVVEATAWLCNLLLELCCLLSRATIVIYDNVSFVYLASNHVQTPTYPLPQKKHQRTKNVEIDFHFVRERVVISQVRELHVPSAYQFEFFFTKCLPAQLFWISDPVRAYTNLTLRLQGVC